MDDLIGRLRTRAADPERRVDARASQFFAQAQGLDLGGLLGALRDARADLDRAVDASREGRVDPYVQERARDVERSMSTPVSSDLPPPANEAELASAEGSLGFQLPSAICRVYTEVADGGFGPGFGLLSLEEAVARYQVLRTGEPLPRGRSWPEGLMPLVHHDPAWECVEASTGRVIDWDPEELEEWSDEEQFSRSFREEAPSVESWLWDWVESKTAAEQAAEQTEALRVRAARDALEQVAAMTSEERARLNLPTEGWERVFLARFGVDEDDLGER